MDPNEPMEDVLRRTFEEFRRRTNRMTPEEEAKEKKRQEEIDGLEDLYNLPPRGANLDKPSQ